MNMNFYKYHGAGNDFIMIDNRQIFFPAEDINLIKKLCDRHFGIGADGLILLEPGSPDFDFSMRYFNADGKESTMCGNGGRCTVRFAKSLGIINQKTVFSAIDGLHEAGFDKDLIWLKMSPVMKIIRIDDIYLVNTGSPHAVVFKENIKSLDVVAEGRKIRYNPSYADNGTNVNFVKIINENTLEIRTYERGVEDETLACGTGSVASAVALHTHQGSNAGKAEYRILARGGELFVSFKSTANNFQDIVLKGPAVNVFSGEIDL